ncbi:MAG: cytochrome c peroxidase [Fuerstiella sp.]|jgi:cytochrome c peroxidase|nr:cytochrome c peroxidase [Fuerstiella sp.]
MVHQKLPMPRIGLFVFFAVMSWSVIGQCEDEEPTPPLGLPPVYYPDDNLYSTGRAELGKLLYFDKRLSSDGTVSCASCHGVKHGFTDGAPVSTGINGQQGGRSAPTVINRGYSTAQFWDGRAPSLEAQAIGPIANPIEMTNEKDPDRAHQTCIDRLHNVPEYRARFKKAYGDANFTIEHVGKAIATFERTVLSGNAPYDRFKNGAKDAMSASAIRGKDIFFNKTACDSCHLGFNFTDGSYANIGIGMNQPSPDLGRYAVSKREEDKGAFKTPTLREIQHTGPYMHDGSLKTLEDVVEHYDKGGIANPYLDERLKPLKLSEQDKQDLVEFMKSLSGEGWQMEVPSSFPPSRK